MMKQDALRRIVSVCGGDPLAGPSGQQLADCMSELIDDMVRQRDYLSDGLDAAARAAYGQWCHLLGHLIISTGAPLPDCLRSAVIEAAADDELASAIRRYPAEGQMKAVKSAHG